jgi:hypothetical protein
MRRIIRNHGAMMITSQFTARVAAFLDRFGLSRGQFGVMADLDRDFVRDLEQGRVGLRRLNKAHEFMERVEADPKVLEGLRQANQEGPATGVPFAAGEFDQASREGEFAHGEMGNTDLPDRHLEHVQR